MFANSVLVYISRRMKPFPVPAFTQTRLVRNSAGEPGCGSNHGPHVGSALPVSSPRCVREPSAHRTPSAAARHAGLPSSAEAAALDGVRSSRPGDNYFRGSFSHQRGRMLTGARDPRGLFLHRLKTDAALCAHGPESCLRTVFHRIAVSSLRGEDSRRVHTARPQADSVVETPCYFNCWYVYLSSRDHTAAQRTGSSDEREAVDWSAASARLPPQCRLRGERITQLRCTVPCGKWLTGLRAYFGFGP